MKTNSIWITWTLTVTQDASAIIGVCVSACLFAREQLPVCSSIPITTKLCHNACFCQEYKTLFFYIKVKSHLRYKSEFKNKYCSRPKLLRHTLWLSWPKLLCPEPSTCYQLSIRYNGQSIT